MAAIDEVCVERTENRDPRKEPDVSFRYVDISSVDNRRKVITEARSLLGKEAPSRARQVIRANDVLVATTRPNLNAVALVPLDLDNEICSTGFCVLRPNAEIEPDYLFAFVQTTAFVRSLSDLVKGALYPAVTDGQVRAQRLPLPPLPEQHRIATRLCKQLVAVAEARAAVQAQLEAAQNLPIAHLRAVFEGKNLGKWQRKRIGEIAEVIQNGIYKPAEQYGHGLPFVRMYNVSDTTWKLNLSRLAQVDLEASEQAAFSLRKGDLLVSRVNSFELVGKCAWVGPEAEGYV
jgi:type I restriction enzyme, S subunit